MEAKSFKVIPHYQYPNTRKVALSRNFSGVNQAIVELKQLRDSLSLYDPNNPPPSPTPPIDPPGWEIPNAVEIPEADKTYFKKKNKDSVNEVFFLNSEANGCGSPNAPGYEFIPNFPFKSACDAHDACFDAGLGFGYCNDQFISDMNNLVPLIVQALAAGTNNDNALFKHVATVLLNTQGEIYHLAVNSQSALDVYCGLHSSSIECQGTNAVDTPFEFGQFVEETSRPNVNVAGIITYYWSCELWSFPDGNGGRYLMHRNCRIFYDQP